ncbi:hypothetical protein [Arenibaculum pallidiluteum]|uniref:hypothetical protein n=1 Tax=Arenibaculum pallidiluteum TaxID=2812559 RepID=UPI001A96598C|nr:hypothetical protein [Arenibaculum pallidiluteum]
MLKHDDVIERSSIVTYALMQELHEALSAPDSPDDVSLGMIMGLAMFLDDKIGPMRSQRLMEQAPRIILKTDAHVTEDMKARIAPVLRAFAEQIKDFSPVVRPAPAVI